MSATTAMSVERWNLDRFIQGETIDLCVPTADFAKDSDWFRWFNDKKINRYLDQGLMPNSPEAQVAFLQAAKNNRLLLVISDRSEYVGVVSLSELNMVARSGVLAIVIGKSKHSRTTQVALEASALICEHGFKTIGLNRIEAGQHPDLHRWQQRLELIGFRLEGIRRNGFVKGREQTDKVLIGATYQDYEEIVSARGSYWDSTANMSARIASLPSTSMAAKLKDFVRSEADPYYANLFRS